MAIQRQLHLPTVIFTHQRNCKFNVNFEALLDSRNDTFVTATANGTISLWGNGRISKSFDCDGLVPLIKVVHQDIIVVSRQGKLLVLDTKLNVTKRYDTINDVPWSLSATRKYIAIGTHGNEVIFYNRNGSTEPRVRIKLRK